MAETSALEQFPLTSSHNLAIAGVCPYPDTNTCQCLHRGFVHWIPEYFFAYENTTTLQDHRYLYEPYIEV